MQLTAAMIPVPMQKAIAKLGMIAIFPRGFVTLSATKRRLKVRIASMTMPFTGRTPGPGFMECKMVTLFDGCSLTHGINAALQAQIQCNTAE